MKESGKWFEMEKQSFAQRIKLYDRIIWICLVFFCAYLLFGELLDYAFELIINKIPGTSAAFKFVMGGYAARIGSIIALFFICLIPKNREIWKSFIPTKKDKSMQKLWAGMLIGFLMNFFCILCAILHGDIKLYFDLALKNLPILIVGVAAVMIQSAQEEVWTRGFMYERINVHYPLWVAMLVNAVVFGALHGANPGITPLAMADLILCGLGFSLLKWYTGSIWAPIGVHTMWNYTQNLIFGLPNSGIVSEASFFHMDAVNATSNWIYDYTFGVEGAVPGVFVDLLLGVLCLYLGWKQGRIGELFETKEKKNAPPEVAISIE